MNNKIAIVLNVTWASREVKIIKYYISCKIVASQLLRDGPDVY